MYTIKKDGSIHEFVGFGNAYLGWPMMWNWFEHIYFPLKQTPFGEVSMFTEAACHPERKILEPFWHLAYDPRVPVHQRIALRCSYDGAMAKKEDFAVIAAAMRSMAKDMHEKPWRHDSLEGEVVMIDTPGHLPDIAAKIDEAVMLDDVIGCCWQGTTVDADQWNDGLPRQSSKRKGTFNVFKDKNPSANQYWIDPARLGGDGEIIKIE
jgi:hypothetical protein